MIDIKDTGGSAFPFPAYAYPNGEINFGEGGMTLREYAAIHLKVPSSGTDWLDDMIRQSLKNDFAAKAMQSLINRADKQGKVSDYANTAYLMADAMLEARAS